MNVNDTMRAMELWDRAANIMQSASGSKSEYRRAVDLIEQALTYDIPSDMRAQYRQILNEIKAMI